MSLNEKIPLLALTTALAACGNFTSNPYDTDSALRVPGIRILTPERTGELADGSFLIKVAFERVLADDSWTLYYVSNATPGKGAAIGQDLPVTARTLVWDTSAMPAGAYYLYGELKSLNGVITAPAAGSIVVDHPTVAGNSSPLVSLGSPAGGETLVPGTTATVRFSASDADGDAVTFALELSADDGNSWTPLAAGIAGASYDWEIPASTPVGLTYRLRVVATDAKGASGLAVSDRPFAIL